MKRILLSFVALMTAAVSLFAQQEGLSIPEDVFYLMPKFGKGTIVYRSQAPAQGTLNICALDNSIRFKDNKGVELALDQVDDVVQVVIDGVSFLRLNNSFLRVCPITDTFGLAVKRDVLVMTDSKQGAYGMESQTTSIREISSIVTDGMLYELNKAKQYPYRMSEIGYLYKGGAIMVPSKKNFQKCFPTRKDEIDAWFKEHKKAPTDREGLEALCRKWAE